MAAEEGEEVPLEQLLAPLAVADARQALPMLARAEPLLLQAEESGQELAFLLDHRQAAVRAWVVRFLAGLAARHASQIQFVLATYVQVLEGAEAAQGGGRAVPCAALACCGRALFDSALCALAERAWPGRGGEQGRAVAWATFGRLKDRVVRLLDAASAAVRLHAAKAAEALALLTAGGGPGQEGAGGWAFRAALLPAADAPPPPLHAVGLCRAGLAREAADLAGLLAARLREAAAAMYRSARGGGQGQAGRPGQAQLLLHALGRLGRLRFAALGRAAAAALAGLPQYVARLQPTSHVASVAHALRVALCGLLRAPECDDATGRTLVSAMGQLGARELAEQLWARARKKRARDAPLPLAPAAKSARTAAVHTPGQAPGLHVVLEMVLANLGRMVRPPGPGVAAALAPGHAAAAEQVEVALRQLQPLQEALGMAPAATRDPRRPAPAAEAAAAAPLLSVQQLSAAVEGAAAAAAAAAGGARQARRTAGARLTAEQCRSQAQAALMRVLRADEAVRRAGRPAARLQEAVLARLLRLQSLRNSRLDEAVGQMLAAFARRRAAALQWLYVEFVDAWTPKARAAAATQPGSRYHSILLLLLSGLQMRPSSPEADGQLRAFVRDVPAVTDSVYAVAASLCDAFAAAHADPEAHAGAEAPAGQAPPAAAVPPGAPPAQAAAQQAPGAAGQEGVQEGTQEGVQEAHDTGAGEGARPPLGLALLLDVAEQRATARDEALERLLAYTAHPNTALRTAAVRMAAGHLFVGRFSAAVAARARAQVAACAAADGDAADLARRLQLFLALAAHDASLLDALCESFPSFPDEVQAAVCALAQPLLKGMGQEAAPLLLAVEQCPEGAHGLALAALRAVTLEEPPGRRLVEAAQAAAERLQRPELLVPVLAGMTAAEARPLLPALARLPPPHAAAAVDALAAASGHLLPLPELLVSLHAIEREVPLKQQMAVVQRCLELPAFSRDVVAVVLQRLLALTPPPTLLLRTVLQALAAHPSLLQFVVSDVMPALITKQVWTNEQLWGGFGKVCLRTAPHCYPVVVQLAPEPLADLVRREPTLASPLLEYLRQTPHASQARIDVLAAAAGQPPA